MAFNVRPLNHSPAWYFDNCSGENGSSPAYRKMFEIDMLRLEAADDKTMTYMERISLYQDAWDRCFKEGGQHVGDIEEVVLREDEQGYKPARFYVEDPFLSLGQFLDKNKLTAADVSKFLKWRARKANVAKAREAKALKAPIKPAAVKLEDFF